MALYLTDNDVERVARRVAELVWERMDGRPELMTTAQCAAWLGITPSAVRTRVSEGRIPAHKHGGRLVFDKNEITKLYMTPRSRERAAWEDGALSKLTQGAAHRRDAGRGAARGGKQVVS